MKKAYKIGWIVLGLAVLNRMFHLPLSSVFILLSCTSLSLLVWFKFAMQEEKTPALALADGTICLLSWYFMFRLQFWSFTFVLFFFATIVFAASIVVMLASKKSLFSYPKWTAAFYILCAVLFFTPSYAVHRFFNLNPIAGQNTLNHAIRDWSVQSWFEYRAGNIDAALETNAKGVEALQETEYLEMESGGVPYDRHARARAGKDA